MSIRYFGPCRRQREALARQKEVTQATYALLVEAKRRRNNYRQALRDLVDAVRSSSDAVSNDLGAAMDEAEKVLKR